MNLFFADTIAGAVAREIRNDYPGGHAYKGAWDRAGSRAEKHIEAAQRDYAVMFLREWRKAEMELAQFMEAGFTKHSAQHSTPYKSARPQKIKF